jgi:hypothetical protein
MSLSQPQQLSPELQERRGDGMLATENVAVSTFIANDIRGSQNA